MWWFPFFKKGDKTIKFLGFPRKVYSYVLESIFWLLVIPGIQEEQ